MIRLDIESLRTFKAVLEHGGVTRAAKSLNLTQSAVSHKLARLEERIGRPILVKNENGFTTTSDGQGLLQYAERLISLHDEAAEHFRSSELAGKIHLGATEDATSKKLSTVLGRFGRVHVNVSLYAGGAKLGAELLADDRRDRSCDHAGLRRREGARRHRAVA
jgi:DNA-binding transcriptional LysR family regulator